MTSFPRTYIYIYMFIYMYTSLCVCSIRPTTWAAAMHVVACVCALFAAEVLAPDNVYIHRGSWACASA